MKKKFYRGLFVYALYALRALFSLLPFRVGFSLGGTLGKIVYFFLPRERRRMLTHLETAFGNEKTSAELRIIVRRVFEHYGKLAAELLLVEKIIKHHEQYITIEGEQYIEDALKRGQGVIGLVAHFGNWELMGGYLATKGYPMIAVARKIYYDKYNDLLLSIRKSLKVEVIYRDGSIRHMLGVLKQNKVLVFAADQDVDGVDGIFVSYFKKLAYTPMAPVRFALATGAPILTAHMIRKGIKHHIIIDPPLPLVNTGNKENDLQVNTQAWIAVQEKYIRENPDLWVWNHRRWKTTP